MKGDGFHGEEVPEVLFHVGFEYWAIFEVFYQCYVIADRFTRDACSD